ncbi:MAG: YceI family protein [Thermotogae bacterium]|nr:YceI family protein [Thermotogota bacterium]
MQLIIIAISGVSFVSGSVQYKTVLKAMGALPDPVSAKSRAMKVEAKVNPDTSLDIRIVIPVRSFKSGNTTRDREVAKILGYPKHKFIFFRANVPSEIVKKALEGGSGEVEVEGTLKVRGKEKTYTWNVKYEWVADNRIRLSTGRHVKFTDFGIKPPTLFGFVKKAPDDVEVEGTIVLEVEK